MESSLPGSQACSVETFGSSTQVTWELEGKGESETAAPDMTRWVPEKRLAPKMLCQSGCNEPVPSVFSALLHSPWNERLNMDREGSGPTGAELIDGVQEDNFCDPRMPRNAKARAMSSTPHDSPGSIPHPSLNEVDGRDGKIGRRQALTPNF